MATILNLGCGGRTHPLCVNIDWSIHLRIARNRALKLIARPLLSQARRHHIDELASSIMVHDLRKGIPFPDEHADAVYHSHVLEHIDRNLERPELDPALNFLRECFRVLRPGGVLRVVVPDLEATCRAYLRHVEVCQDEEVKLPEHDAYVERLLGQAVRREAFGTARQREPLRAIENALLGDARRRGETHQWEYDRFNLTHALRQAGFSEVHARSFETSAIPQWSTIDLDRLDGAEYKPGSIYLEAVK